MLARAPETRQVSGARCFLEDRLTDAPFSRDTVRTGARAAKRAFMADYVRKNGVGAELGVFWGHFSEVIVEHFKPKKLYLVDCWDLKFGEFFPKWGDGANTDNGRLTTAETLRDVRDLMAPYGDRVEVRRQFVADFLSEMPDGYFDWVYLDTTHSYENTLSELRMIRPKLKPGGVLLGDDFHKNPETHPGVQRAVREFADETGATLTTERAAQYILTWPKPSLWRRFF
jgi:hypothetical protein